MALYCSVLLYAIVILLMQLDTTFAYRWLIFWLHIISMLLVIGVFLRQVLSPNWIWNWKRADVWALLLVFLMATAVNFFALAHYPYVNLGDEVRDGGLDALLIAKGEKQNIFDYGYYDGYGLIIPTISSFFFQLLGSSTLTYRLPAALIATVEVLLLFLLVRQLTNSKIAFFSSLVLATHQLHLYFVRADIVVVFNSFWATALSLLLYLLLQHKKPPAYAMLGVALGFAAGFHTSVRIFAGLMLIFVVAVTLIDAWRARHLRHQWRQSLSKLVILLIFCLVGFGPRLLHSQPHKFFQTGRLVTAESSPETKILTPQGLEQLKTRYVQSLFVWVYEPASFWYPVAKPLLPPVLAGLFLIGIAYAMYKRRSRFYLSLVALAVATPFFISAITNYIGADHRMNTLIPLGAIFVGLGIMQIFELLQKRAYQWVVGTLLCLYLLSGAYVFFTKRPADLNFGVPEYTIMHAIHFLQANKNQFLTPAVDSSRASSYQACLALSPANYERLTTLLHYQELMQYFLPDLALEKVLQENLGDNEIYIFDQQCNWEANQSYRVASTNCLEAKSNYFCPIGFTDTIDIYYSSPAAAGLDQNQ